MTTDERERARRVQFKSADWSRSRVDRPTIYDLVWPRPGRPVEGLVVADLGGIVQAVLHWDRELARTVWCDEETGRCLYCHSDPPVGSLVKAYIPMILRTGKAVGLVLGEASYKPVVSRFASDLPVQGMWISAARTKGANSRVVLTWTDDVPRALQAHANHCHDLRPTVEMLHLGR